MNPFPVLLIQRKFFNWLRIEAVIFAYNFLAAALGRRSETVLPTSSTISILHQVPKGHVGVYWRGCALLKTITDLGFHLKLPIVTHFEPIQVTLQTNQVRDIPCGTKGCVMINFEKIEMVDKLDDETMAIELGPPDSKEAL
ncbi:uncharacterized protein [Pyrus communis]|uniref:uncharacterized protein isoform X2 n=1 Tax=Pyrus communis TaxID=23211 RepID=UPI0035C088BA